MNPPPTPPEEGSQCRARLPSSPPGRGQGWVGSWVALLRFSACVETMNHPLTRPSGTLSPSEGERDGVRGRFMGRENLQNLDANRSHEPTPNPSGGGEPISGTLAEFPSWPRPGVVGSWVASTTFLSRIGTMNRCASQRRGPDRGSATRSLLGSWEAETRHSQNLTPFTMNPLPPTRECSFRGNLSPSYM